MFSGPENLLWIILAAGTLLSTCQAQQTCTSKIDQLPAAPELYGFRLGMTPEQAKARAPLIRFGKADELGLIKTSISPSFDPRFDQTAFLGVRTISFEFLDGRLVTLWLGYDDRFKWQTMDEFLSGIRKSLNLEGEFSAQRVGRQLTCEGFSIVVSMIARSPSLRLFDEAAQQTIAARRESSAEVSEAVAGDRSTKTYYLSSCEPATGITAANRISFKNREQAEKAGYILAKECQ